MGHRGRRIRAAFVMGLAWAAAGGFLGFLFARLSNVNMDLPPGLLFTALGFLTGVMFSGVLMLLGRRRGFDRLSLPRFAAWGGMSGLLLGGIFAAGAALRGQSALADFLLFGPALGVAGAICAGASLAIAQKAQRRELGGPSAGGMGQTSR
jgi:hypothetical protein